MDVPELEIPEDLVIHAGHDETTCAVCVYWARACVVVLPNIGNLEGLWRRRDPDDHIWAEASDDQRAFWRESFEHTSDVIEHVLAVRPQGEEALTWHARVLRASAPDDPVAMHNVEWCEYERNRRRGRQSGVAAARGAYPEHLRGGPKAYNDGTESMPGVNEVERNTLLVQWLHANGLEWAQGTRFAVNVPVELIRHPPGFMVKPARLAT